MTDFFEIDFLPVGEGTSGDAIAVRYQIDGIQKVHVVDGGYKEIGPKIIEHIETHYDAPDQIDHVVVTHPDGDHARGLVSVIESKDVAALWMLRPWLYADHLIDRFSHFTNKENLKRRLKEIYPNLALLEDAANANGVPIYEPFQGAQIGAFSVLAPSQERWLDLIVESERTPESLSKDEGIESTASSFFSTIVSLIKAAWGNENFSEQETSAENEMSVVQSSIICGKSIVLTGDAGRKALREAADYAPNVGLNLPGVDRFQVPHHGSRRNLSSELLDEWLGEKLIMQSSDKFGTAVISAGKDDKDHPRNAVVRALHHRGWKVVATKGSSLRTSHNAPEREGWVSADLLEYPEEQED